VKTGPSSKPGARGGGRASRPAFHPWYLVLLIPFIALLWPPFYAHDQPEVWGIPFFYWYQFLWFLLGAFITQIVHVATRPRSAK